MLEPGWVPRYKIYKTPTRGWRILDRAFEMTHPANHVSYCDWSTARALVCSFLMIDRSWGTATKIKVKT